MRGALPLACPGSLCPAAALPTQTVEHAAQSRPSGSPHRGLRRANDSHHRPQPRARTRSARWRSAAQRDDLFSRRENHEWPNVESSTAVHRTPRHRRFDVDYLGIKIGGFFMEVRLSRRRMMQGVAGAAMAQSLAVENAIAAPATRTWPIEEGPDTPHICLAPGGWRRTAAPACGPRVRGGNSAGGRGGAGGAFGGGYGSAPLPPATGSGCGARTCRRRRTRRRSQSLRPAMSASNSSASAISSASAWAAARP